MYVMIQFTDAIYGGGYAIRGMNFLPTPDVCWFYILCCFVGKSVKRTWPPESRTQMLIGQLLSTHHKRTPPFNKLFSKFFLQFHSASFSTTPYIAEFYPAMHL